MNLQYLNIKVIKIEKVIPIRTETIIVNKKSPRISKRSYQIKSKSKDLLVFTIKSLILENNTIVTTSFNNDSPNITENSFGWISSLIVKIDAISSMLHIQVAKSNIYTVSRFLTLFDES